MRKGGEIFNFFFFFFRDKIASDGHHILGEESEVSLLGLTERGESGQSRPKVAGLAVTLPVHKPWCFLSLLVQCRQRELVLQGQTLGTTSRMDPHSWQCIRPVQGTVLPKVRFSLGKKKKQQIVCTSWHLVKFSFFFSCFYTKSSIALTLPMINHYFTDKLWKCDPGISSCKIFTAAGENIV